MALFLVDPLNLLGEHDMMNKSHNHEFVHNDYAFSAVILLNKLTLLVKFYKMYEPFNNNALSRFRMHVICLL